MAKKVSKHARKVKRARKAKATKIQAAVKKEVKLIIVNGQRTLVEITKQQNKKATGYEKYVEFAKVKYNLPDDEILTKGEYEMNILAGREKAKINNDPSRKWTPEKLARAQAQGEHTDKQIRAMWRVAKEENPELTKREFIRQKGWETFDNKAALLYEDLKIKYPDLTTTEMAKIISQQIYGSE